MAPHVTVRRIEDVPDDVRVCHYDELGEPAKERFPALADGTGATSVEDGVAAAFGECDLVKYTEYYEVARGR